MPWQRSVQGGQHGGQSLRHAVPRSLRSLGLLAAILVAGQAWACPTVRSISIVSSVDGGAPDGRRKLVRSGQVVTLYAVVETTDATWSAAGLKRPEKIRKPDEWPAGCPLSIAWHKVEAEVKSYYNPGSTPPVFIEMRETEWKEGWSVMADVHPTLMHDEFPDLSHGLGVMRFKVTAGAVSSPGMECRESGAPCRAIHAVAYRKADTYLGYLYEMYNAPYIYGSKKITGGHQSDLLVGSDCADFVVYGKRREKGPGKYPYTFTGGLHKLAKKRTRVKLDADGYYLDARGKRLMFGAQADAGAQVLPGDLLNFEDGHVGVLVRDDGDGVLDTGDYLMHTLHREPETVPIKDCRWPGIGGKEVLRLK